MAGLKLQGSNETATFIQNVLDWWNMVNVSAKGQDKHLNDPNQSVQDKQSINLNNFLQQFETVDSGHGASRKECLTHDTKKALVQTMKGLISLCKHLLTHAEFDYVLLREIQSDKIESEFSVYRQSTGSNAFMTSSDVFSACKKRLARHAVTYLESLDFQKEEKIHTCMGPMIIDDATAIESIIENVTLTTKEESSAAYVAGWLEHKCEVLINYDEEPLVSNEVSAFVEEVSRGSLKVPHQCTYDLVRFGLTFVKKAKHRACCRQRLVAILSTMQLFYDIGPSCDSFLRHLANVLLNGLHNLEKRSSN